MLSIHNLSGGYRGYQVLKHVEFSINSGELVGLIGLNGAGKSTTIKHILGLLHPQEGSITLNELDSVKDSGSFRKQLAYVPEAPILYPELTLREHLELSLAAYQLDAKKSWPQVMSLLTVFRLETKLDWFPSRFSKGMRQKVMLVNALMVPAALTILDEPFNGLDPLAVQHLLQLLKEKRAQGQSLLLTTHILAAVIEQIDRLVVLDQGQVVMVGTPLEVAKKFKTDIYHLDRMYLQLAEGHHDRI